MNRRLCIILLLLVSVLAYGQDVETLDIYGVGDQTFSISAAVILPLFIHRVDGEIAGGFKQLSLGATGSLRWGTFLTNELTVGVDVGGMFAFTTLGRTLVMLPISGVVTYAIRFYPFELLLHGGIGLCIIKLDNDVYVGPSVIPGLSFYWNYNAEWSFGLKTEYWWIPEIYVGDSPPSSQTAFGNFLGITLSTLYHF